MDKRTIAAGIGMFGLQGKIYVDNGVLRLIEHGVGMEIAYQDIVEVEHGVFSSWISIRTSRGLYRKVTLFSQAHKKIAAEIRSRAGLK